MTGTSLVEKLKLKPGKRAAVIHPPQGYLESLEPLPDGVELFDRLEGSFSWIQIFVQNTGELEQLAPQAIAALEPESLLWISFPKGASGIQTDLTRDKGWESLEGAGLKWINLVSVSETWSRRRMSPPCASAR